MPTVKKKEVEKVAPKKIAAKKSTPKKEVKVEPTDEKQKIIATYAKGKGDTGSPEVQGALLSYKITKLAGHLEINKKDNHSRRGLLKVIAKRRRILNYLQKLDETRYKDLIGRLGLKK